MDDDYCPLNWDSYYQEEGQGIQELKHTLLYTFELESTIACAHEEISRKGDEVLHFKCLLTKALKERDEAQLKCQGLVLENIILQQKIQELEANSSSFCRNNAPTNGYLEDEHVLGVDSSSGSEKVDEDFLGTEGMEMVSFPPTPPLKSELIDKVVLTKGLPEYGKFLQAVVEAGPLLQTLLLAGPLPQWQHPPPQLNSIEIPPITIPSTPTTTTTTAPRMLIHQDSCVSTIIDSGTNNITRKRSFEQYSEGCDNDYKPHHFHQEPKVCSPIIIDQHLVF